MFGTWSRIYYWSRKHIVSIIVVLSLPKGCTSLT